ncbi:response regulator [Oxalobacteraceae bacterium OM1]|nr:response regulator [Oxalobacteraceae bacterium OM1]
MLRVTVLDANAISRNLLSSVLLNGGFEVVGDASATAAGIASMAKLQPQLVCIDVGTHDEEGYAKIDAVRAALPKAVLFLVSGQFSAEAIQAGRARGVHGFIVKPFNAVNVLAAIRKTVIALAKQHRSTGETPSAS